MVGLPRDVLTISETGEAVALAPGDAHVFASGPSGTRVGAGQPATVTVVPGDGVCGFDVLESICRTVRVVAPSAGTMTVEAVPVGATSIPARLYLLTVGVGEQATGNPGRSPTAARVSPG